MCEGAHYPHLTCFHVRWMRGRGSHGLSAEGTKDEVKRPEGRQIEIRAQTPDSIQKAIEYWQSLSAFESNHLSPEYGQGGFHK